MIKIFYNTRRSLDLQKIDAVRVGAWIHVEKPNDEDIAFLLERFQLDAGLLQDARDQFEVPRIEMDEGNVYVFTRVPYRNDKSTTTAPVLVILGKENVITISQSVLPIWERFVLQKVECVTTQRLRFFFQIFYEISLLYTRFVTEIRKNVQVSMADFDDIQNKDIVRFVRFENTLNNFLSALLPTNVSLNTLLSGKYVKLYEEDQEFVEDVLLSNEQLIESCRVNLAAITNIRNAHSTIMTNNLNRVIKLLTALTIVFTIPTMIASFFGMNVRLPGNESPVAFVVIVGIALIASLGLLIFFYYKDWLK